VNEQLALKILSELLEWGDKSREEFSWLRLMSRYKYDSYQGYEPGLRFFESLIGWLTQFEAIEDRRTAYAFLKDHLIYFSRDEIVHLVHRLYPTVRQILCKLVAEENAINPYEVWGSSATRQAYEVRLRQTLFVGLSDGARMDVFRRANEGRISNEQVVVGHEISDHKWGEMRADLVKIIGDKQWAAEPVFKDVFLIDDFTASGTSLIRQEESTQKWVGKIGKFIERNKDKVESGLLSNPCRLHIHHYLASDLAKQNVESLIADIQKQFPAFPIDLTFGHVIDGRFRVTQERAPEFYKLLLKHYDSTVETKITKCVKFGYKDCSLAVVLEHNTPNNSVGLLWAETQDTAEPVSITPMTPLFRRRTRHF
jgi:hypothetical protein